MEFTREVYAFIEDYIEQLKQSLEIQKRINQKKKELREENLLINTYEEDEYMFWNEDELFHENYDEERFF